MADYVLWKQLTQTDFNSMHGLAAPAGTGGGARHIALGVSSSRFPLEKFLNASGKASVSIDAKAGALGSQALHFASNVTRRSGEWIITDQRSHRHLAWTPNAGFPSSFNPENPPVILVLRVGGEFHARHLNLKAFLAAFPSANPSIQKGISVALPNLLSVFSIDPAASLELFENHLNNVTSKPFDPTSISDGRKRKFAEIVARQGQGPFRNALLMAYNGRCAITRVKTAWVLEAAHIVPYLGPKTNEIQNGLLLRSDVHTLFDIGLVSIEPKARQIKVSKKIIRSPYGKLHNLLLHQPASVSDRPSVMALEHHYERFEE